MDEQAFTKFLKSFGKKPNVVAALVSEVKHFAAYLEAAHQLSLDQAGEAELRAYLASLPEEQVKERLRAVALYYKFAGKPELAKLASALREQRIAKTRSSFKLGEFRGVDPAEVARLEAAGLTTVDDLLLVSRTPQARRELAERTGVAPAALLELVKLSDLSRLGAVKAVRARLYYDAGLDTPGKFTRWEVEPLRLYLVDFVARTGFEGIPSLPKELANAIAKAKSLPPLIEYEE